MDLHSQSASASEAGLCLAPVRKEAPLPHDLPQILLISPSPDEAAFTDGGLTAALEKLLRDDAGPRPSVLLLRDGSLDDTGFLKAIAPLVKAAQAADVAVLLENRVGLVEAAGCDGVHITLGEKDGSVKRLRQRLGDDLIIGAGCNASRHAAIQAGDEGADYIAFGAVDGSEAADPELVDWWVHWMTPPLVALGAADLATAKTLAARGAEFIALAPGFWLDGPDPAAAFAETVSALCGSA